MSDVLVAVAVVLAPHFGACLRWGLNALLKRIFSDTPLGALSTNVPGGLTMSLLRHVENLPLRLGRVSGPIEQRSSINPSAPWLVKTEGDHI